MHIGRGDPRYGEFSEYKKEHGFSPDELWALDLTIANFILPRLKAFQEVCSRDIKEYVDKAVNAFEILAKDDSPYPGSKEESVIAEGLAAFAKVYRGLWC